MIPGINVVDNMEDMKIRNRHKNRPRRLGGGVILALALLVPGGLAGAEEPGAGFPPAAASPAVRERRALLVRGNGPVKGLPGFAENAFSALYGQYRLELSGETGEDLGFELWASREPLYLSGSSWEPGQAGEGYTLFRQVWEEEALFAVLPEAGGFWTLIFRFPEKTLDALEPAGFNRIIEAWLARFFYFSFLAEGPGDMSLPAVVNF
jgi:hypothetical protein